MSWIRSLCHRTDFHGDRLDETYTGSGTQEDPYIVDYLQNDHQDAMRFSDVRKWTTALSQAISFFAVTFGSSVYASSIPEIMQDFQISQEMAMLGLALYVLGFAVGPILWAPMSEVYGRKPTFIISYTTYLGFTIAAPYANNITALLLLRFFASAFGSSAQTNPGAIIADMFAQEERGSVMAIFAACPFLGPALGILLLLVLDPIDHSGLFTSSNQSYRSHSRRFYCRNRWLALDSWCERNTERFGLAYRNDNHSGNVCAGHTAMSREDFVGDDGEGA